MVSSSGDQESIWWAERAQGVYPAQEVWIDMKMHIVALCVLWVESTLSNFWVLPCSKSCGSIVIRIGQLIYLLITVILHVMSIFIPICCMAMSEVLLVVYIFCQDYPVLNSYFGNDLAMNIMSHLTNDISMAVGLSRDSGIENPCSNTWAQNSSSLCLYSDGCCGIVVLSVGFGPLKEMMGE